MEDLTARAASAFGVSVQSQLVSEPHANRGASCHGHKGFPAHTAAMVDWVDNQVRQAWIWVRRFCMTVDSAVYSRASAHRQTLREPGAEMARRPSGMQYQAHSTGMT